MSILLINPPRSSIKQGNIWKTINRSLPSLGLAYIAAYLEKIGEKVLILDIDAEGINFDELYQKLKDSSVRYVGITATTVQVNSALYIAGKIKGFDPSIKIIFGGPHPHIFTEEILALPEIDFVVRGEGEETVGELLQGRPQEDIAGLSYKKGSKIMHNKPRPPIANLDSLPFPARHLLPMKKYRPSAGRYRRLPAASMIATRGCPGKCTFCYTDILGPVIRFRSANNILEEIKLLKKDYGIMEISFYDDTFTANKSMVSQLCEMMLSENIDLSWSCLSRVDCVDDNILKIMKRSGCHMISYGVESADEDILKNINKKISLEKVKEAVLITKKAGIDAQTSFMIGNPGETEESAKKTINFVLELDPDIFIYNIATPFPGTKMFNWAKENGFLTTYNWDDYDLGHFVMHLPTISPEAIHRYYKYAYRKYYCRPHYIISRLKKINSLDALKTNAKIFFAMLNDIILKK